MVLIQFCIVIITIIVWTKCIKEEKIPEGILEWILTIMSAVFLAYWCIR